MKVVESEKLKVESIVAQTFIFPLSTFNLHVKELFMPTISMFYGIVVMMFFKDNKQHNLPHIHVRYQDKKAVIEIQNGTVLDGDFPGKQLKLVQAWIEIHKDELLADWDLAVSGEHPYKIDPLK